MVSILENVEITPTAEGNIAVIPDETWGRVKQFLNSVITTRRKYSNQLLEARKKLTQYKELENLERRIAELQSHRIELIRDFAQEEQIFADSFDLKDKLTEVLGFTQEWNETTQDVYRHIHVEKKAVDVLRRTIRWIEKHSNETESRSNIENRDRSNVFQEGKVVYRTCLALDEDRYYILTIYTHDQACTEYLEDMPYCKPTFSSSMWQEGGTRMEHEGMAVLMKTLMTEEMPKVGGETGTPVFLIVLFDIRLNEYHMFEHQPTKDVGCDLRNSEETIISHVKTQLHLNVVDETAIPILPGVSSPMRQVWSGKREIIGDRKGLFHINIFELDMKTWLIRVHDHCLCKLYSHVLPKDLLYSQASVRDQDALFADERGEGISDPVRVKLALKTLTFNNGMLNIQQNIEKREIVEETSTAVEECHVPIFRSLNDPGVFPFHLTINKFVKFDKFRYHATVRLCTSFDEDLIGIVISNCMERKYMEQIFILTQVLDSAILYEISRGNPYNLEKYYTKMKAYMSQGSQNMMPQTNAQDDISDTENDEDPYTLVPTVLRQSLAKLKDDEIADVFEQHEKVCGFSLRSYRRVMMELLEFIKITEDDEVIFSFPTEQVQNAWERTLTTGRLSMHNGPKSSLNNGLPNMRGTTIGTNVNYSPSSPAVKARASM